MKRHLTSSSFFLSNVRSKLAAALSVLLFFSQSVFAYTQETLAYARRQTLLAHLPQSQDPLMLPSTILSPLMAQKKTPIAKLKKSEITPSIFIENTPLQSGSVKLISQSSTPLDHKIIFHIQDIHLEQEAQRHIADTISSLGRTIPHLLVGLEGSDKKIDLSIFHEFPDSNIMHETAEYLFRQQKITGPVLSGFLSTKEALRLEGIEDKKLYDANVVAVKDSAPQREYSQKKIQKLMTQIAEHKKTTWSRALLEWDDLVESYRQDKLLLSDYVKELNRRASTSQTNTEIYLQASELEGKINFQKANAERTQALQRLTTRLSSPALNALTQKSIDYRLGRVSHAQFYSYLKNLFNNQKVDLHKLPAFNDYLQYILLADAVDPSLLYQDLNSMEERVYASLCSSPEQKALYEKSLCLHLTQKLVNFSLTSNEWARYKQLVSSKAEDSRLDLTSFEAFYELAEQRNTSLLKNLYARMDDQKTRVAVLVTGGFHTEGLERDLVARGATVLQYTPRVTHVENQEGFEALSLFTQEKTPLDQLFEGQKLFLAQNPMASPTGSEAILRITAKATDRRALPFSALRTWFQKATGWTLKQAFKWGQDAVRLTWVTAQGIKSAAFYRNGGIVILNTTFFGAPLLTLIHLVWFNTGVPSFIGTLGLYLAYKVGIYIFTLLHEAAHSFTQSQKFVFESASLHQFLMGTDLSHAWTKAEDKGPIHNRWVALAGPLVQVSLIVAGYSLLTGPAFALGTLIIVTNSYLLTGTVLWGDDIEKGFLGKPGLGYGIANIEDDFYKTPRKMNLQLDNSKSGPSIREGAANDFSTMGSERRLPIENDARLAVKDIIRSILDHLTEQQIEQATLTRTYDEIQQQFVFEITFKQPNQSTKVAPLNWDVLSTRFTSVGGTVELPHLNNGSDRSYILKIPLKKKEFADAKDTDSPQINASDIAAHYLQKLSSDPDTITIPQLVFLLQEGNAQLQGESFKVFKNRFKSFPHLNEADKDAIQDLVENENKVAPPVSRIWAALFFNSHPKYFQFSATLPLIDFEGLHKKSLQSSEGNSYRITFTQDGEGSWILSVKRKFPLIFTPLILFLEFLRLTGPFIGLKKGTFKFQSTSVMSNTAPEKSDIETLLNHLTLTYSSTLPQDVLDQLMEMFSDSAPRLTEVKYIPTTDDKIKIFTDYPLTLAFRKPTTGFELSKVTQTELTFKKVKDSNPATADLNIANSTLTKGMRPTDEGLAFTLIYPLELLDEVAHLLMARILGRKIDWTQTQLLRLNPHIRLIPDSSRPYSTLMVTSTAPLMWAILSGAFIYLIYSTYWLASFSSFYEFSISGMLLVVFSWYLGIGAIMQIISNLVWSDNPNHYTDLQSSWYQLRSLLRKNNKTEVASLPEAGDIQINSSLARFIFNIPLILASFVDFVFGRDTKIQVNEVIQSLFSHENSESETRTARELVGRYNSSMDKILDDRVAAEAHNYGYWIMGAKEKIKEKAFFVGAELGDLTQDQVNKYLSVKGIQAYRERTDVRFYPSRTANLIRLSDFNPLYIEEFYSVVWNRPDIGREARRLIDRDESNNIIVSDLFARPWRKGEDKAASLEELFAIHPDLKPIVKTRLHHFVAMAMALKDGNEELGYNEQTLWYGLWNFMKITNYQEESNPFIPPSPTGDSFLTRPQIAWKQYAVQLRFVMKALPENRRTNSRFLPSQWLAPLNKPLQQPAPVPQTLNGPTLFSKSRTVVVRPGGEDGNGVPLWILGLAGKGNSSNMSGSSGRPNSADQQNRRNANTPPSSSHPGNNSQNNGAAVHTLSLPQTNPSANQAVFSRPALDQKRSRADSPAHSSIKNSVTRTEDPSSNTLRTFKNDDVKNPQALNLGTLHTMASQPPFQLTLFRQPFVATLSLLSLFSALGLTQSLGLVSPGFEISRLTILYASYLIVILFALAMIGHSRTRGQHIPFSSSLTRRILQSLLLVPSAAVPSTHQPISPATFADQKPNTHSSIKTGVGSPKSRSQAPHKVSSSKERSTTDSTGSPHQTSQLPSATGITLDHVRAITHLIRALSLESGKTPLQILNEFNAGQIEAAHSPLLSLLLETNQRITRRASQTDQANLFKLVGQNDAISQDALTPIEFLQFRRIALVLQKQLQREWNATPNQSRGKKDTQWLVLHRIVRLPGLLTHLNSSNTRNTTFPTSLGSSVINQHPGQPLLESLEDIQSKSEQDDAFSSLEDIEQEQRIAFVSAVETAADVLAKQQSISTHAILQQILDGSLSPAHLRYIREFTSTVVEGRSVAFNSSASMDGKDDIFAVQLEEAAQILLTTSRQSQKSDGNISGQEETTGRRGVFNAVLTKAAAGLLISGLAAASAAATVEPSIQHGLNQVAITAVATISSSQPTTLNVAEPKKSSSGEFKATNTSDRASSTEVSETELNALAEAFLTLHTTASEQKETNGKIDIDALLPPLSSVGLRDKNLVSTLPHLSSANQIRLAKLVADKLQSQGIKKRLSMDEARQIILGVYQRSDLRKLLQQGIGNKDVALALEGGAAREQDIRMIEALLPQLGPSQSKTLYLFVSPADQTYYQDHLKEQAPDQKVEFIPVNVLSQQNEKHVFNFESLAMGLNQLSSTQIDNLVVLLQDGISWDANKLDSHPILNSVGFILLKDFVSGVPVRSVDIGHIEALAKILAIQS